MSKRKMDQTPNLKLYYFNIKGKGEPIRLKLESGVGAEEANRFTLPLDVEVV